MNHDTTRCLQEPGAYLPIIDLSRCEAKGPCVPACPYEVLAIRPLSVEERSSLSMLSRLKSMVHGNKRAMAVNADACRACGYCVEVCPEKAITLRKRT